MLQRSARGFIRGGRVHFSEVLTKTDVGHGTRTSAGTLRAFGRLTSARPGRTADTSIQYPRPSPGSAHFVTAEAGTLRGREKGEEYPTSRQKMGGIPLARTGLIGKFHR